MEQDALAVLQILSEWAEMEDDPNLGNYEVSGHELEAKLAIGPNRINDAVQLLYDRDLIQRHQPLGGTAPYRFAWALSTTSGRLALQQALAEANAESPTFDPIYDIFLSHSGLDDDLARDIQELLNANGITVFCTPDSIPSGKWEPQIEVALEHSSEIWVLLTPNALNASVWVHQEFGYFYGFNRRSDSDGHRSHYLFEEGTLHPGLYDHLQGTSVENLGDPETEARRIAEALGRVFEVPSDWGKHNYSTSSSGSVEDDELYRFELREMTESDLSQSIRQGGHWEFSIRPASYNQERLEYPSIYSTVRESYLRHTDWDFPSMDGEHYAQSGASWKGEEFPNGYRQVWRMSQTGQFVILIGFPPDLEKLIVSSAREGNSLTHESLFSVNSAVIYVTVACEFAANLCRSQPSCPR
jgi:hypothetical protein